jgi:hypothetical protein
VTGEVSASNNVFALLATTNQNIQDQFTNLRDGTTTARFALLANFAGFATEANSAGFATVALEAPTQFPVYYSTLTAEATSLSASVNTSPDNFVAPRVSLSRSGLFAIRGAIRCQVVQGVSSASVRLAIGLSATGAGSGTFLRYTDGSPSGLLASITYSAAALAAFVFKGTTSPSVTPGFVGPAAGTYELMVHLDGILNVTASALAVLSTVVDWLPPAGGAQTLLVQKGSTLIAERIGDSIAGGL